jgi:hypothetical protein
MQTITIQLCNHVNQDAVGRSVHMYVCTYTLILNTAAKYYKHKPFRFQMHQRPCKQH